MTLSFPSDTKSVIDTIRGIIGREITVYVAVAGIPCTQPGCSLDPVTGLSTNSFCTVCGGNYWINTISGWTTSGHIRWRSENQMLWVSGGKIMEGDCRATITFSDEGLNNVKNSKYFVVDGETLYMKNFKLKGVQPANRIQITLLEDPDT